jgi:hypothetical protein
MGRRVIDASGRPPKTKANGVIEPTKKKLPQLFPILFSL